MRYHDGQMILNSYENQNALNGKLRNKLSHLIISHTLKQSIEKKYLEKNLNYYLKLSQYYLQMKIKKLIIHLIKKSQIG